MPEGGAMRNPLRITVLVGLTGVWFTAHAVDDAYKVARDQANATYKADRKGCKDLSGEARQNCLHIAKEKREAAMMDAEKLKTHGSWLHGDASRAEQSYSQLPASGAATTSQPRTAGNQPGEFMGNAPTSANSPT
jgi:hypothetical protein